jgi:hypothetical protein
MNKRILFSIFAAVLFWSTAIVLAQEQAAAPSFKDVILGSSIFPGRGRLPVRQIKTTECMNCPLHKEPRSSTT